MQPCLDSNRPDHQRLDDFAALDNRKIVVALRKQDKGVSADHAREAADNLPPCDVGERN